MPAGVENHIALLIFANTPEAEQQRKVVGSTLEVFEALTQHTLRLAEQLELPYYHFTEKEQVGETFGERYINAIKKIFSLGYDGVITIGNDSPSLKVSHLKTALKRLQLGNSVIGPSLDGGFYLLAITRNAFLEDGFLRISWNSSAVFGQMLSQLKTAQQEVQILKPLVDLDTPSDIALAFEYYFNIPFGIYKILLHFYRQCKTILYTPILRITVQKDPYILNRGSPAYSI